MFAYRRTQGIYQAFELLSQMDLNKCSANKMTCGVLSLWKTLKAIQSVIVPNSSVCIHWNNNSLS
jgi:hypothetical protein